MARKVTKAASNSPLQPSTDFKKSKPASAALEVKENSPSKSSFDSRKNQVQTAKVLSKEVNEDKIRLLAYFKWEAAGKPNGDGSCYWFAAEHELISSQK